MDVLVGMVSFTNYSSIDESGIGAIPIIGIQDWIEQIVSVEVQALCVLHSLQCTSFCTLVKSIDSHCLLCFQ